MAVFRIVACTLILVWVAAIALRYRRSTPLIVGGLAVIGAGTLVALATGVIEPRALGLGTPGSWATTLLAAAVGTAVLLAYSPLADRLASRVFAGKPDLGAFRQIRQSPVKLVAGIVAAWVLGGFLEELTARGLVFQSIDAWLSPVLSRAVGATVAIVVAAVGAALVHLYQGPRAALIVFQLSTLLGVLMIVSGHNLWTVIICHGLYDTVAFVRYASGKSRYAETETETETETDPRP
jgi:membrane protease YdiL (CAAX protease family)